MQKYTDVVQNRLGLVIEGANVRVTDINGSVATIFSNNGTIQQANPMTTDANGRFSFYAADGRYNLTVTVDNVEYGEQRDILLNDPSDPSPEKIIGGVITESSIEDSDVLRSRLIDCETTGGLSQNAELYNSTIRNSSLENVTIDGLAPMTIGGQENINDNSRIREALRRCYADAGFNLVDGSFEEGGVLTSTSDVMITASGAGYSWSGVFPKVVNADSTPTPLGSGGWIDRSGVTLRSEFTSGGNTPEEIGASAHVPTGLDLTGATDESATIAALWAKWQVIRLPKGKIRADISVPTGCVLLGSGAQVFDRTSSTWDGNGTLVVGTINQGGIVGWVIANLSVDNYGSGGNAIVGLTPDTGHGYLKNVTTRANNHGQLWEANDNNPANNNAIGNIVAEDCLHYGGPNGFVSKHKRVSFVRCLAYDVTVQGVVVASDNINGPSVYSRAQNTLVENCATYGCNEGLRIYSRDYGSTGSVLGAYDTKVVGQTGSGFTGRKIRIGDFTEGSYSRVASIVNRFRDLPYDSTPFSCIHLDYADRTDFKGCHWGYQANVSTGEGVGQLDCDPVDNHIRAGSTLTGGTALGVESGRHIETSNSATITPPAKQRFIILQNTAPITITNIAGANIGYDVTIVIDDAFSTVAVSGVLHSGKGTVCRMRYNGTGWVDLGEYRQRSSTEKTAGGSAAAVVFDLSSGSINQLWTANGVSITSVTLAGTAGISAGEELTLRITNGGASPTVTISGWDAAIKWPDGSSAPASLAVARKLIVKLKCIGGGVFVATSQTIYV